MAGAEVVFEPLIAPWLLLLLGGAGAAVVVAALAARARGAGWRALVVAALWTALLNPTLAETEREPLDDVALVAVDRSASQRIGGRQEQTEAALAAVVARIDALPGVAPQVVEFDDSDSGETRLFASLARALSDTPPDRIAGTVAITDGRVHDAAGADAGPGPLHVLLTGAPGERDRRLSVERAPGYGVVGERASVVVRVDDDADPAGRAQVEVRVDGGPPRARVVAVGEPATLTLPVDRAGPVAVEVSVAPGEAELTLDNNRAIAVINGVRDRMRVMLVSGAPNQGLRAWRNLLKADPSVDLVHFTILRPPNKQDMTPVRELSLIPFPTAELFDAGLEEFDLIVFDGYHRRGILPMAYLANVVDYVVGGGAVLDAAGPAFASPLSIAGTPLGAILPGRPTGRVFRAGFVPRLTAAGLRHPVTERLWEFGAGSPENPGWGRWFRHIDVELASGTTLMEGAENRPLLVLDRIGEGRVAQLLSDQSWLWSRGFGGGGPQSDLLRRLVHWLMKEPDLEEESLAAEVAGDRIEVVRRSLEPLDGLLKVVAPDGAESELPLVDRGDGRAAATVAAAARGAYRLEHGGRTAIAVVGAAQGAELADMRATAEVLAPLAAATGGAVSWLAEDGIPDIRRVRAGRAASGRRWIGLVERGRGLVTGLRRTPLPPGWLLLALALGGLMLAWRAEGR